MKAIAYKAGMTASTVASASYTIVSGVSTPTLFPSAGSYTSTQTVRMSTATAGAAIRYTTDGSTPSATVGTLYSGPFAVSATTTVKAMAYAAGMADSGVATALYSIVAPPVITSVTPTAGVGGTLVTIAGSGLGAARGSGGVWLGSVNGLVVSWSDKQVVANVATGSVTGVARVQQNGSWSNAVTFTVAGGTVTLVPNVMNLEVGQTQVIQARGTNGQAVTGLSWSSSNTGVVSLSASDPPALTAVAAGRVTITATSASAGGASADVTVVSGAPPLETVLWSNPVSASQIIPAVPSQTGVADVFAVSGSTVHAITSEGITAWTVDLGETNPWVLADFRGGLVAVRDRTITSFDGRTGQAVSAYSIPNRADTGLLSVAVHTDGTIFAHLNTRGTSRSYSTFVGIDPVTGGQKFSVELPNPRAATQIIVAGDGYAYMGYAYPDSSGTSGHLKVVRVDSGGRYSLIDVWDWQGPTYDPFPFYGEGAITNADDGILLSWQWPSGQETFIRHLTRVSSSGASDAAGPEIAGQEQAPITPMLQMEDGTLVGVAWVGTSGRRMRSWCRTWWRLMRVGVCGGAWRGRSRTLRWRVEA